MLEVYNTVVPNVPKAPKPSSNAERVPQGTKPGAKPRHKKHSTYSTQPSVSSSRETKDGSSKRPTSSKTGHLKRKKESSSAMDSNPSQTSTSTLVKDPTLSSVVIYLHSHILNLHSESASGNDALADLTTEADPEIFAPNDFIPYQQGPDEGSKNYTPDLTFAWTYPSVLVDKTKSAGDGSQTAHPKSGTKVDTRPAFMNDEDQDDEPFIASEERSEENAERNKDIHAEHKSTPNQKLEQDKQKDAAEIATLKAYSIPTELKEPPTKITVLSGEVNELKKHIKEFEIKLSETLEALTGLLNKVTDTLKRFSSILNAHNKGVPSAGKSTASPTKGEKNTNLVTKDVKLSNLVDLIGIDVVEEYHKKKLLYNKYCDKMLKRKKNPKITNYEVLTKKGPITLKIYREDGSEEVISNLKVSDLHLAEWREVIQSCPDKSEKGWKTIYALVKTRLDRLTQTEQDLKIDLNKPLKEQDPLNELNELVNKTRKRASDFSDEPREQRIFQGKVYWIYAKEVKDLTLNFHEDKKEYNSSDEESFRVRLDGIFGDNTNGNSLVNDTDVDEVSETNFSQGDNQLREPQEVSENEYPPDFTPVNDRVVLLPYKECDGEEVHKSNTTELVDSLKYSSQEIG
ncbi:hypothetical protein Tco_0646057 [Tanacetum coccineum]